MTTPAATQQPVQQPPSSTQQVLTDAAIVAGLAALLAAVTPSLPSITRLLMRSRQRVSRTAATAAARIVLQWGQPQTEPLGVAGRRMQRLNIQRRAQYLLAAARRITQQLGTDRSPDAVAGAIRRELQYWRQHVYAGTRREQAAAQADNAAERDGVTMDLPTGGRHVVLPPKPTTPPRPPGRGTAPTALPPRITILGWKAQMDDRTTAECRAADGKNWILERPPKIGLPGTVHVHCRCQPVPPYPTRRLVDGGLLPEVPR